MYNVGVRIRSARAFSAAIISGMEWGAADGEGLAGHRLAPAHPEALGSVPAWRVRRRDAPLGPLLGIERAAAPGPAVNPRPDGPVRPRLVASRGHDPGGGRGHPARRSHLD